MHDTKQNEGKMVLFINGEEAKMNMEVTTFRGEPYILTGWRAPGELCGGQNGKVYCKNKEDFEANTPYANEWYPGVIGGEFKWVEENELVENLDVANDEQKHAEEQVNQQPLKRRGR